MGGAWNRSGPPAGIVNYDRTARGLRRDLAVHPSPWSLASRPTDSHAPQGVVMTDFVWTAAPWPAVPAASIDRLDRLVARVASGDRVALRCLYAFLAVRVWHTASRTLPHPADALAVTRSTFLEVWHTAGGAGRYDARDWIQAIAAVRVDERQSVLSGRNHADPPAGTVGLGHQRNSAIRTTVPTVNSPMCSALAGRSSGLLRRRSRISKTWTAPLTQSPPSRA